MKTALTSLAPCLRWISLSCALLAPACFLRQELDESAARGSQSKGARTTGAGGDTGSQVGTGGHPDAGNVGSGAAGGPSGGGSGGGPVLDGGADACDAVRSQARTILEVNCAFCHQAPGNQANFDFILDLDKLKTGVSSTGQRFVVPGDPDQSRIYQRMSVGEMPPAGRMPRPSMSDIEVIRQWIASCFDGTGGWDRPDSGGAVPDAGVEAGPPPGCGDPGQPCCTANICHNQGCCVLGQCRGDGQTCGASGGGLGLSGTCSKGSCENSAGMVCGNVGQPCCEASSCTASRVSCLAGMTTCSACGGPGEPCCKIGSAQTCIDGQACVGGAVGRTGTCQDCGAMGQPCCGTGVASQKTCDPGLTCAAVLGMGDRCGP
jgi:hypothetical protein